MISRKLKKSFRRERRPGSATTNKRSGVGMPCEQTMPEKINLAEKFSRIKEYWKPYIAGELNGQLVKLDKLKGEFVWHNHENEDEMFLVKGRFRIEFRDKTVWMEEGEFIVVPRRVEHKPVA